MGYSWTMLSFFFLFKNRIQTALSKKKAPLPNYKWTVDWAQDSTENKLADTQTKREWQADSRLGLYDLLLWDTHRVTHKHTHTSWDIQTCHWTGLPLSWEDWYPLISEHTDTHTHTHHNGSLGKLIRTCMNLCVCVYVCMYACAKKSLMARIRDSWLSLSVKNQPAKNMLSLYVCLSLSLSFLLSLTHTHTHACARTHTHSIKCCVGFHFTACYSIYLTPQNVIYSKIQLFVESNTQVRLIVSSDATIKIKIWCGTWIIFFISILWHFLLPL